MEVCALAHAETASHVLGVAYTPTKIEDHRRISVVHLVSRRSPGTPSVVLRCDGLVISLLVYPRRDPPWRDTVVAGTSDGVLYLWDARFPNSPQWCSAQLNSETMEPAHFAPIVALGVTEDRNLISMDRLGGVCLWSPATQGMVMICQTPPSSGGFGTSLTAVADGTVILCGSRGLRIWTVENIHIAPLGNIVTTCCTSGTLGTLIGDSMGGVSLMMRGNHAWIRWQVDPLRKKIVQIAWLSAGKWAVITSVQLHVVHLRGKDCIRVISFDLPPGILNCCNLNGDSLVLLTGNRLQVYSITY
jgi:hypothetical protein